MFKNQAKHVKTQQRNLVNIVLNIMGKITFKQVDHSDKQVTREELMQTCLMLVKKEKLLNTCAHIWYK